MTERERKIILGNDSKKVYRMFDQHCKKNVCVTCHYHRYNYCLVQWILDKQKEALTIQTN